MMSNHNERDDSSIAPDLFQQQTPTLNRKQNNERTTNKRPRSYISPPGQQQSEILRQSDSIQHQMTHPTTNLKMSFPPIVVKFNGEQKSSIKEITDELTLKWKKQHGIDLTITARFGHMHSLLIFADDSPTFESFLDPNRWPKSLKEVDIEVKVPRQLPSAYSLIIQQFHRNWNEDEWLLELQQRYVSLYKITRMRVKDGSPLNAVRADFKSVEEVKTLIRSGKINIGSMIHTVKPYHLPIRINKCFKCLRHDHTTKSCSRPRVCPRCAQEHSLENGCPNPEKCINCSGDHTSGHSACPVVQEKRRALVEQSKKQRTELLVQVERQQHLYNLQEGDYPALVGENVSHPTSHKPQQPGDSSQRSYAQVTMKQREQGPQKNIDYTLSTFLIKMERRLNEFSSRLSSQLCDIEKKINVYSDRLADIENIINDLILPSIQEVGRMVSHSPKNKNKNTQEVFIKLNNKINDFLINQKQQLKYRNQLSLDNIDYSPQNGSP
jgi:hypothetical protein